MPARGIDTSGAGIARWRGHDLVVWDNRCTLHRGRAYDDTVHPRDMRRVTLSDSAPTLEQAL